MQLCTHCVHVHTASAKHQTQPHKANSPRVGRPSGKQKWSGGPFFRYCRKACLTLLLMVVFVEICRNWRMIRWGRGVEMMLLEPHVSLFRLFRAVACGKTITASVVVDRENAAGENGKSMILFHRRHLHHHRHRHHHHAPKQKFQLPTATADIILHNKSRSSRRFSNYARSLDLSTWQTSSRNTLDNVWWRNIWSTWT